VLFRSVVLVCLFLAAFIAGARAQSDTAQTFMHHGIERRFVLHTPPGNATQGPRPTVVVLQGSGQPLQELRDWLPMEPVADREGFVVVYPEPIDGRWNYGERPDEKIDDLGFIDSLVERLVAARIADPARVYLAGVSRGALMSWTMICRRPDRFAAMAALSSGMSEVHLNCAPKRLIPIVAIAGTADSVQPYDGWSDPPPSARLLSVPETMDYWRRLHRCSAQTMRPLPHRIGGDATVAHHLSWATCTRGGPVVLFRIVGGEHEPPARSRGQDIDAAEEVWRFFRESPKRRPASRYATGRSAGHRAATRRGAMARRRPLRRR
jgi:polyhydroxybutyrate depolymerase